MMIRFFCCGLGALTLSLGAISVQANDLDEFKEALKALDDVKAGEFKGIAKNKHLEALRSPDLAKKAQEALERINGEGANFKDASIEAAEEAIRAAKSELSSEGKTRLSTELPQLGNGRPRLTEEEEEVRFSGTYLSELDPGPQPTLGDFPSRGGYESPEGTVFISTGKNGASLYDLDRNLILFTGTVALDHPNFYMTCERLEVHLVPPSEKKEGSIGTVEMERAIATSKGQVVIERKLAEGQDEDELEVGRCRKATYFGASGDVLLEIWPEIQKGRHVQRASKAETVISLPQGGQPKVTGMSKVVLSKAPPKKIQRVRPE